MKQRTRIVFLFVLLYATGLTAQTQFFSEDFENPATHGLWTLNFTTTNPPPSFANRWHIGTAINNGGDYSLYISDDGGLTPGFTSGSRMIAKRKLHLTAGLYELSFDWLSGIADGEHILEVAWVPENVTINNSSQGVLVGISPPPAVVPHLLLDLSQTPPTEKLTSSGWRTSWFNLVSDGTPHYLVFVFRNTPISVSSRLRGAAVDNIRIFPQGSCDVPENITVTASGNSLTLSWTGTADSYEVRAHNPRINQWYEGTTTTTSITFDDVEEGGHHFWVRAVCDGEEGRWVRQTFFVRFPERHCIDFLGLTEENTRAFTGGFYSIDEPVGSGVGDGTGGGANQLHMERVVDFGYADARSRHTIHWDIDERDPRTGGGLQTVPEGAIASVRLGNWLAGSEAERIEYFYTVDTLSAGILLLRYALVLEDGGHNEHTQSRFDLRIFHGNQLVGGNQPIPCGTARFVAVHNAGDAVWHQHGRNWWKDWSTVGINLREFHGETLRIQFTMRDCRPSAHFGYAYFVLGCASGELEGLTCGEVNTHFTAPPGFQYVWYRADDPNRTPIVNTDTDTLPVIHDGGRILEVAPNDTLIYRVRVIFPAQTPIPCYFTLEATAMPRFPVAEFSYHRVDSCSNLVEFHNTSRVVYFNQVRGDTIHASMPIEASRWDFGHSSIAPSEAHTPPLPIEFPMEGGDFDVSLRVGISGWACDSTLVKTISLPDRRLRQEPDTTTIIRICLGSSYTLSDGITQIWTNRVLNDTVRSVHGCDSIFRALDIRFGGPTHVLKDTIICTTESMYLFEGELFVVPTETVLITSFPCEYGCAEDNTITWNLRIIRAVEVEVLSDTHFDICADEPAIYLHYEVLSSFGDVSYQVEFPNNEELNRGGLLTIGAKDSIRILPENIPGIYRAYVIFMDENCGNDTVPLQITINYPSSMLIQKWNNVIAILDIGTEFSDFLWHKDGRALHDQTRPYLHIRDGELEFGTGYSVLLTRASDGTSVFTCEFVPEKRVIPFSVSLFPTILQVNESAILTLAVGADVFIYDVMGIMQSQVRINSGGQHPLVVSDRAGSYVVRVHQDNGLQQNFRVLVR